MGAVFMGALVMYVCDWHHDKNSDGWNGFRYWNYRRAPSGLSTELYAVTVGGRKGFIDSSGQVRIEPRFRHVGRFQEGLCAATEEEALFGYIDSTGAWVVPPRLAMAGYVDETGRVVWPPSQ